MSAATSNSPALAAPRGHYSHVASAGGLAWISGQMPTTGDDAPFRDQVSSVLDSLDLCLAEAGARRDDLVSVRVFLADLRYWTEFDQLFGTWCAGHAPTRIVVPSPPLRDGLLLEVEAVASVRDSGHDTIGSLDTTAGVVHLRRARAEDVPAIVGLLADDVLGAGREDSAELTPYLRAFSEIDTDPNQLLVAAHRGQDLVATLQLTIIPGLSRRAVRRAQLEAVRVANSMRGRGLGTRLLRWAADEALRRGAGLLQLTSDLRRADAIHFYETFGMTRSHAGMKLELRVEP